MSTGIEGFQPLPGALKAAYGTSSRGAGTGRASVFEGQAPLAGNTSSSLASAASSSQEVRTERLDVGQTMRDVNSRMERENRSVRFRFDESANRVQIQVVDNERQRVIRSMPSDEMLGLAVRMRELSGLGVMVDQSR
ncbi:MAG: flagellar protein FlaG [Planctomycetes bacterium]|nr:flagellar protein FlaG [Planctomycetota bacterium]